MCVGKSPQTIGDFYFQDIAIKKVDRNLRLITDPKLNFEKTLRLIHNDFENKSNDLLEINNEVTFHAHNNQKPMIEVHKSINDLITETPEK